MTDITYADYGAENVQPTNTRKYVPDVRDDPDDPRTQTTRRGEPKRISLQPAATMKARSTAQRGGDQMARPTHVHDPNTRQDRHISMRRVPRQPQTTVEVSFWTSVWAHLMIYFGIFMMLCVLAWGFMFFVGDNWIWQWHHGDAGVTTYHDRIYLDGSSVDANACILNGQIIINVIGGKGDQAFAWGYAGTGSRHVEIIDARDAKGQAMWRVTVDGIDGPVIKKVDGKYQIVAH